MNERLERAIENVGHEDTPESRRVVYEQLLEAELLVPVAEGYEAGAYELDEDQEMEFVLLERAEGTALPVFTSEERFLEWKAEGGGYAAIPGALVFEIAAENDLLEVLINPDSAANGLLTRREIESLARGRLPAPTGETMREGTTVRLGKPARRPPDDVLDAVREAVARDGRAVAAWLFQVQEPPRPPEHAVGIAFAESLGEEAVQQALSSIVQRAGEREPKVAELLFVPVGLDFGGDELERLFELPP